MELPTWSRRTGSAVEPRWRGGPAGSLCLAADQRVVGFILQDLSGVRPLTRPRKSEPGQRLMRLPQEVQQRHGGGFTISCLCRKHPGVSSQRRTGFPPVVWQGETAPAERLPVKPGNTNALKPPQTFHVPEKQQDDQAGHFSDHCYTDCRRCKVNQ